MNTLMKHISSRGVAGTSGSQKALKAIALLLVFCIADVYVLAGNRAKHFEVTRDAATRRDTSVKAAKNIAPNKILLGRLFVPYHQEILVNGHSTMSGDSIISGSRLQTPNAVDPAKVDIGSIAKIDIEPNTDLLLTFDQRSVEVKVAAGNTILSTVDGVKGELIMPDGEVYASMPIAQPTPPSQGQAQAKPDRAAEDKAKTDSDHATDERRKAEREKTKADNDKEKTDAKAKKAQENVDKAKGDQSKKNAEKAKETADQNKATNDKKAEDANTNLKNALDEEDRAEKEYERVKREREGPPKPMEMKPIEPPQPWPVDPPKPPEPPPGPPPGPPPSDPNWPVAAAGGADLFTWCWFYFKWKDDPCGGHFERVASPIAPCQLGF